MQIYSKGSGQRIGPRKIAIQGFLDKTCLNEFVVNTWNKQLALPSALTTEWLWQSSMWHGELLRGFCWQSDMWRCSNILTVHHKIETTASFDSTWDTFFSYSACKHVSKQGERFKKQQAWLKCLKQKILFSWVEVRGRQLSNSQGQGICSGSHGNICLEAMGENEENYAL